MIREMYLNLVSKFKNKLFKNISYTVVIFSFIMNSCGFDSMYENTANIPKGKWDKNIPLQFTVPINDTLNSYNIVFSIRNNDDYPYSNIFIFVDTHSPKNITLRDTIELDLCDNQGKWYGKGIGGIWQNNVYFRKNVRFPHSGEYNFSISQAMRDDYLDGIIDLGIKIEQFSK